MSRDLDSALVTEITAPRLRPIFMAEFLFDGGDVRFWNGLGELTYGGNVYTGAGNLLGISEYEETQKLEAIGLTFTLSGISSSILEVALDEPYQGRVCNLYFAAIDSAGSLIAPYLTFSGLMDVMEITEAGETCSISVSAESKMIIITRNKEKRYTDEDQKNDYPNDLGFQFVTQLQDKEVIWRSKQ